MDLFASIGTGLSYIDARGNAIWESDLHGREGCLMLDAHMDSIPLHSADRWSVGPFGGELRDGKIFGLGICDQKASLASVVAAVRWLIADGWEPQSRVVIVASVAEEQMEGVALELPIERYRPTIAVTTEPTDAKLFIGQRGRAKLFVEVLGQPAHAGHSAKGRNAAVFASRLVSRVADEFPRSGSFAFDLNCIDIHSEPYPSVSTIPGYTLVRFDARFGIEEGSDSVIGALEALVQDELVAADNQLIARVGYEPATVCTWNGFKGEAPEFAPAWSMSPDSEVVLAARRALNEVGLSDRPGFYSFCTNGSFLAGTRGIPTIGFGVGEEHMAHQIDEYVTVDSIHRGTVGFRALIGALSRGQCSER
jgi:acetylornithine deacetylase/succinyl-diaminopimelate desuccinylase-like protein